MNTILSAPKTDTYHFRINPEVRAQVEEVYAKSGLSFTQAINVFIQQSLDAGGFHEAPDEGAGSRRELW